MRTMTTILVSVLTTVPLSVAGVDCDAPSEAHEIVALAERTIHVTFPQEPPPMSLSPHVEAEIQQAYEVDRDRLPYYEFFDPATLKRVDRKLFRSLIKLWNRQPEDLLRAVPCMIPYYSESQGLLREMILEAMVRITADAQGSKADRIQQQVFGEILNTASEREVQLKCLKQLDVCGKTEHSYTMLLDRSRLMATTDCDQCFALVTALRSCPLHSVRPEKVDRFLVEVVGSEQYCDACRVKALDKFSIGGLPDAETIPTYKAVMESDASEELSTWLMVMLVQAEDRVSKEDIEPILALALSSKSELVRVGAVSALERVSGGGPNAARAENLFGKALGKTELTETERGQLAAMISEWRSRLDRQDTP